MNKKHMQRHIDSLARQLEASQAQESRRRKIEDDNLEAAVVDATPGSVVLVVTESGRQMRATVVNVRADTEMIRMEYGGQPVSVMPGLRTIRIELGPKP